MNKALIWLLLPVLLITLCGCRREVPLATRHESGSGAGSLYSEEAPLIGVAETREEAEEIAKLYGITLLDFSHNTALYHTDEDPRAVIRRGPENGWPELSLNYIARPF